MEANMNNMQMQMDPYMHNAFWLEDRITVTFQLEPGVVPPIPPGGGVPDGMTGADQGMTAADERMPSQDGPPPTFDKTSAISALNVKDLNSFLDQKNFPMLNPIDFTDTLRAPGAIPPADPQQVGKYLFTSRD